MSDPVAPLRVGLCQIEAFAWDVERNVQATLAALQEAAEKGADIAITPECLFHKYAGGEGEEYLQRMQEIAEPLDGPNLQKVRDVASRNRMAVVIGFAEKGENGNIHNTAVLIGRDGEIIYRYRKVHCRPFESRLHTGAFTPGEEFYCAPISYSGGEVNLGTMICFDREIPEAVRCLRSLGAEFIACPLATITFDIVHPENRADNEMVTRIRAAENEVFIAVVNHTGPDFEGRSFIVGPHGDLRRLMGSDPGVDVVDVDIDIVKRLYHSNPLGWMGWGYRRQDVYNRYLTED